MTLNEAHERQRRELISLRAKVARLEKQLSNPALSDQTEALERHIRHLEQVNKTEARRHEEFKAQWKRTESLRRDLEMENLELREQLRAALSENETLRQRAEKAEAEVAMLNGKNDGLQKKLNTNFQNSSLPSSALPFRKKVPNSRKPSGKKPGGQPGHKAHTAPRLKTTKEPVILEAPAAIADNPNYYITGKTIRKQLVDIRVFVNVTDYIAYEYRNRKTGTRTHAAFPNGIVNDVNYGATIKAFAFLLNNYYNVSIAKTRQCISDITNGVINLSTGTICRLSSEFSAATAQERAKIFSLLTHSDILYSDATVSNVNGKRKAVILCTDKEHVLYQHLDHKGHAGLSATPVKGCRGAIVHDHDKSYYSYGTSHQECNAHILRYLVGAMENEPHLKWPGQMHSHIRKMIHAAKKHKGSLSENQIRSLTERYDAILEIARKEYEDSPSPAGHPDSYNLYKRLCDYKDAHLYFLTHPDVDYTNNICERELRKFKRKQKQAVVFRSNTGAQYVCDALSIIETSRMLNRSVFYTVQSAFAK